jgi:hypothetical protein
MQLVSKSGKRSTIATLHQRILTFNLKHHLSVAAQKKIISFKSNIQKCKVFNLIRYGKSLIFNSIGNRFVRQVSFDNG